MVLTDILKQSAQKYSQNQALTMRMGYRTVSLSYREVYDLSRRVAVFLELNGVGKGDKVLVCAANSPYWIILFWGCLLRGAIIVPLNIQSTPSVMKKIADQTEAKIFFKGHYLRQTIEGLAVFDLELLPDLIDACAVADFKEILVQETDLIEILYTSGTTGDPKGVMLTHQNLASNLASVAQVLSLNGHKERLLSILPLSHIYEQTIGFLLAYSVGAQIIYAHSHAAIRGLMKEYKITKMLAVPEFLKVLMTKIEASAEQRGKKRALDRLFKISAAVGCKWFSRVLFRPILKNFGGCLDAIASGGAPLDPLLEKKWQAMGVTIMQGYGLTETSPVISSCSFKEKCRGSVGKVVPGVQVKLGEDNEIQVKGPSIFQGYFKNEEKTKEAFTDDGWFRTGDIGQLDADGFLFLKGRKKYMIKGAGAQNIFPEDIETFLNERAEIKDSCVIGIEREGSPVEIHAVLLFKQADQAQEGVKIIDEVNSLLASFQQINAFTVWSEDDFPRSATRKVKKNEVIDFVLNQSKRNTGSAAVYKSALVRILSQITGIGPEEIHDETKIIQGLRIDSLLRIELMLHIEESLGVFIDETKITPTTTVSDLEKMVENGGVIPEQEQLKEWPRSLWARLLRMILQPIIFGLSWFLVRIKVEGAENLEGLTTPVIFMPNHVSYFDSFAVNRALPYRIGFKLAYAAAQDVLYDEFKKFSLLAELIFNAFSFPRRESDNIKRGLDHMGRLIDKGYSVVLFPEGKISETGALLPFKTGAGLVAVEMHVPVVPIKIEGLQALFPPGKFFPCRVGKIVVRIGKPLIFKHTTPYAQATNEIEFVVQKL